MKLYNRSRAVLALFVTYSLLLFTYSSRGVQAFDATPNFGQRRLLNLSGSSEPSVHYPPSVGHRRLLNLSGSFEPSAPASPNIGHRRLLNLSGSSEPSTPLPPIGDRRLLHVNGNSDPFTSSHNYRQRKLLNFSGSIEPIIVPSLIEVGPRYKLTRYLKAKGFQEYTYAGDGSWTLVNASAELFTCAGKMVGVHYFLPEPDAHGGQLTWELFSPSSRVTAAPVVNLVVSPSALPWLLMRRTGASGSLSRFGVVEYVQRLSPTDGLPPDLSYPAQIGNMYRSPYTATYAFYRTRE